MPWRYPTQSELVYGEWLRKDFEESRVPKREPDPDLAIVLTKVGKCRIPILGPDARQLLDPVPTEHLKLALSESLPGLVYELKGDERNVLLTLVRIRCDHDGSGASTVAMPRTMTTSCLLARIGVACG